MPFLPFKGKTAVENYHHTIPSPRTPSDLSPIRHCGMIVSGQARTGITLSLYT